MDVLQEKQWKANACNNLFDFQRGSENNMASLQLDGNIPLVSAKAGNNGVKAFVKNPYRLVQGDCITLNNDGDGGAGLAYYQPFNMALDSHVTALKPKKNMRKEHMLFISECLSGLHGFFGHGLSISNARAKQIQIMLPTDEKGVLDYDFMERYVSEKWGELIMRYKAFLKNQLAELEHMDVPALSEKEWKPVKLSSLFENYHGRRLVKENRKTGDIPLLTANSVNNGVAEFIGNDDMNTYSDFVSVDMFCNTFIHPYTATGDDNIYFFKNDDLSIFTKHFICICISKQQNKFSYGKQFRQQNADNLLIMLPTTNEGKPDWDYMEQYAKNLMLKKYQQYLEFLEGQVSLTITQRKENQNEQST